MKKDFVKLIKKLLNDYPHFCIVLIFCSYLVIGVALLEMPFAKLQETSLVNSIFNAASAISTTGLMAENIAVKYSLWGQIIILALIKLGGIGTLSVSGFVLSSKRSIFDKEIEDLTISEWAKPEEIPFSIFLKRIILFSFFVETAGTVALSIIFALEGESHYVWKGLFHAVSAFNTAGFSLFEGSLTHMSHNPFLAGTVLILSITGATGFFFFGDLYLSIKKIKNHIGYNSSVIAGITGIFILFAVLVSFLTFYMEGSSFGVNFFHLISAQTTVGFSLTSLREASPGFLTIMMILMVIGASPGSTGGGIKTLNFFTLINAVRSTLFRKKKVKIFGKKITDLRVKSALAALVLYLFLLCLSLVAILFLEKNLIFKDVLFEIISAISTVGLSLGITESLEDSSKLIISALMLIGRVGILAFSLSLTKKKSGQIRKIEEEVEDELAFEEDDS